MDSKEIQRLSEEHTDLQVIIAECNNQGSEIPADVLKRKSEIEDQLDESDYLPEPFT